MELNRVMHEMRICFLVSGSGGNLKFLSECISQGFIKNIELSVIADRKCGALNFAKIKNIQSFLIKYSRSDPAKLRDTLRSVGPDLIITNWHKIIDEETVNIYRSKLINLHYSLLPAFGGLIGVDPIKKAYENGCKFIGPTCHYVDEGVDTGNIIAQAIFTTEIAYEDAVQTMFQTGCLTLLNAITILAREKIMNKIECTHLNSQHSPMLKFNPSYCNEDFWKQIASL